MKNDYIEIMGKAVKIEIHHLTKDGFLGQFTSEPELLIKICKTLKGSARKRVLLHECYHAMLWISGIGCHLDMKTEESIVMMLEMNLEDVIKNSKLVF